MAAAWRNLRNDASSDGLEYKSAAGWANLISSHGLGFAIVEFGECKHDGFLEFFYEGIPWVGALQLPNRFS